MFSILLRAYLSALYTCRLNFCLFFIFRSRQAGIVSTVLLAVSLTLAKNLSAVSLILVNTFSAVSLTPVNSFSAVSLTPVFGADRTE